MMCLVCDTCLLASPQYNLLGVEMLRCILLLSAILFLVSSAGYAQTLTTAQAKAHEGETTTVCGVVASEHTASSSRGTPTFINLDAAYPNPVFTVLIWGEDLKAIAPLPSNGQRICVRGLITDYRGTPEMVVKTKSQIAR